MPAGIHLAAGSVAGPEPAARRECSISNPLSRPLFLVALLPQLALTPPARV